MRVSAAPVWGRGGRSVGWLFFSPRAGGRNVFIKLTALSRLCLWVNLLLGCSVGCAGGFDWAVKFRGDGFEL